MARDLPSVLCDGFKQYGNIYWTTVVRQPLCLVEGKKTMVTGSLGSIKIPHILHSQFCSHSFSPLLVLAPHHTSRHEQRLQRPVLNNLVCGEKWGGSLQLAPQDPDMHAEEQQAEIIEQPIVSQSLSISRLPSPHIINRIEVGRLAAATSLLIPLDQNILITEVDQCEHSALICLGKVQARHQYRNSYTFDHYRLESSTLPLQELEAKQTEIVSLKQTLSDMQQQFDTQLNLRAIEKKLLIRALAVAKKRFKGDRQETHASTNLERRSSTLGEHLREEIAAMSLQVVRTQEDNHGAPLKSQQIQVATLQQSLNETQETLEQAKAAHQEREQELQTLLHETTSNAEQTAQALRDEIAQLQQALEKKSTQLSQAEADQQQWESNLQAMLANADRTIDENKARYKAQIATLQQQLQTQESSNRQLAQEKAELASSLNAETQRALEFARQAQSLDERKRNLKKKFETLQQAINEAKSCHRNDVALLREELDQAQQTIEGLGKSRQRLDESLQQMSAELQAQQERERQLESALDESKNSGERTAAKLRGELEQLQQSRAALQIALKEKDAQLTQKQAEFEQRESSLQSNLEEVERSTKKRQASYKAKIAHQRNQIQTLDSSRQQLAHEKAKLASCLQDESKRASEFAGQAESLDEYRQKLEQELETIQQTFSEAGAQHQNDMALLKEELAQAQHTIGELEQSRQQLESALQQTQAEFQAEQERLSQSLESEKLQASENESRLNGLVNSLNSQIESNRIKTIRLRKKRTQLESLLMQEQKTSEQLKQLLETSEEKAEIANKRLTEIEQSQQELQEELQNEIKTSHAAWEKASESDVALQMSKLELTTIKDELEQEIDNLRAQLEHLEENRERVQTRHSEERDRLQQSLDESQTSLKVAQVTIRTLKNDRQSIREAKSESDERFTQLETEFQRDKSELIIALESSRQEVSSLRAELTDTKELIENVEQVEHIRMQLQQANDEKAALKRQVAGLREVQLEMESQGGRDRDTEMTKLQGALLAAEEKCKRAEKLAQQADTLQRERQVQEIAIETLSEDLDALTREKAALIDERDRLQRELGDCLAQSTSNAQ